MFKYFLYQFGLFVIHRFPISTSYRLAEFVSDVQYFFSPRDRRSVGNNLRIITGSDKNIPSLSREVFRNFGRYLVEFFFMKKMINEEFLKNKIKVENSHHFENALKKGKGAILVTGHIGNWELGAVVLSKLGYEVFAIALPHKERPVNDLFNQQREIHGVKVIPPNIAVRQCMEALKNNKIVAIVADRDFTNHGEILDFLGKKTLIPKGPAVFSEKMGAPIVPAFFIRNQDQKHTFTMTICEPIYPKSAKSSEGQHMSSTVQLMRSYLSVIEQKIREYPTQWLMFREFGLK